jgi:hypothetical protein
VALQRYDNVGTFRCHVDPAVEVGSEFGDGNIHSPNGDDDKARFVWWLALAPHLSRLARYTCHVPERDAARLRRHPLAVTTLVLGVYVFIGGLMAFSGSGPGWYHDSVNPASIAMLVPLVWLIRQRTAADPHGPSQ